MNRRELLKRVGLVGAVVVATPVNLFKIGTESKKDDSCRIFFAKMDNNMYLLFDNGNRIFKQTTHLSGDDYMDMNELKINLVDSLIDHYEQ